MATAFTILSNHPTPPPSAHPRPSWLRVKYFGGTNYQELKGIMRTLGRKVIELDPPKGFAAEATASVILYVSAYVYQAPISTTHVITSSIMGVGATKRLSAVRWGVAGNIVVAWIFTIPMAGLVAAIVYGIIRVFA